MVDRKKYWVDYVVRIDDASSIDHGFLSDKRTSFKSLASAKRFIDAARRDARFVGRPVITAGD